MTGCGSLTAIISNTSAFSLADLLGIFGLGIHFLGMADIEQENSNLRGSLAHTKAFCI